MTALAALVAALLIGFCLGWLAGHDRGRRTANKQWLDDAERARWAAKQFHKL